MGLSTLTKDELIESVKKLRLENIELRKMITTIRSETDKLRGNKKWKL